MNFKGARTMTSPSTALILILLTAGLSAAQQRNDSKRTSDMVRASTEKQQNRPFWFVLNSTMLDRISYAYQVSRTRTTSGDAVEAKTQSSTTWCWAYVDGRNTGVRCEPAVPDLSKVERPQPGQEYDNAER